MKRWLLTLLLLLLPVFALAEGDVVTLTVTEDVRGFQPNTVVVSSPEEGTLTLRVMDEYNIYRTIVKNQAIDAGETTITWDGLGENEERIPEDDYTMAATLVTGNATLTGSCTIKVNRCRQALLFALPSDEILYMDEENGDWFVEFKLVRAGNLVTEFCRANAPDEPLYVRTKECPATRIYQYEWDGVVKGERLAPGDYILRFYAEDGPDYVREVSVTLVDGLRPVQPLTVTGEIMPAADASDDEIWQLMTAPATVVTLKSISHQKVLDQPSKQGHSLGTLHGQSQSVNVLEVRQDGWAKIGAWNHETGDYIEGYVPQERLKVVTPGTQYGLLLDKQAQTLTVFEYGKRIGTVSVSTGLIAKNKMIRETAAGSFLTVEHMSNFSTNGNNYDYVIRYDGGNLLHQVAYRMTKGRKDFSEQVPLLGTKASHGCVRIQAAAGEGGINAYWLWTHIPYNTRVIVLDDPVQRAEQVAEVYGTTATVSTMPVAASPTDLGEGEHEITITVGGDVVLGTREEWWQESSGLPAILAQNGMTWPFRNLNDLFSQDDMTLVNLECVLKDDAEGEDKTKEYRFRGLTAWTEVLKAGSIEQVNIANNHYIDYGEKGRTATRDALTSAGIAYSGYGNIYIMEIDGVKIGFGGCRETVYKEDHTVIRKDISTLKEAGCNVVIYSCHWGTEYSTTHNTTQENMAKAAAAAGADIVVGTHPHVVQGIETIDDTLVLYSLGNLMFGGTHEMVTYDGMVATLTLRFDEAGYKGVTLRLLPVLTSSATGENINDFSPILAEGEAASRILDKVQADSSIQLNEVMYFPSGT